VFGSVGLSSGTADYAVEITVPSQRPALYDVENFDGSTPVVRVAKECECTNNTDLGCTTKDCNNNKTCPNSEDDDKCEWENVTVE